MCVLVLYILCSRVKVSSPFEALYVGSEPPNQETEDLDASLDPSIQEKGRPPLGDKPIPEMRSSCCSRLFFLWVKPLLRISRQKSLEKSDIWITPGYNRAGSVTTEVQKLYLEYQVSVLLIS